MRTILMYLPRLVRRIFHDYFQDRFLTAIRSLPGDAGIRILDIGAAGDIEPRWQPYKPILHYVGFEPDDRSSADLLRRNAHGLLSYQIVPKGVWSESGRVTINLCRKPEASSILAPNLKVVGMFPDASRFDIVKTVEVDVAALDDLELESPDFMKLDIQGAELGALTGATRTLESVLGVEIEVEFVALYESQPLFGDISRFMSQQGFDFCDFINFVRWQRTEFNAFGNCIFADALFLRAPESLDFAALGRNKVAAYLAILMIYKRFDLLDVALARLPSDWRPAFRPFEGHMAVARSRDQFLRRLHGLAGRLLNAISPDYRAHILH